MAENYRFQPDVITQQFQRWIVPPERIKTTVSDGTDLRWAQTANEGIASGVLRV
jgi:hypothetical protein